MRRKRNTGIILTAAAIVVAILSASPSGAAEPVFSGDTVLGITIHGDFYRLEKSPDSGSEVEGVIELAEGTRIPAKISKYGISRLSVCQVAPLKLTLSREAAAGTPLADLQIVRFVPPCHFDDEYQEYAALEYLVYRSYQVLASPAVRVRPVDFVLRDIDRKRTFHKGFGYLVEDLTHTADRTGFTWLDIQSPDPGDLDVAHLTTLVLFQYMVGNTDWSVVRGSRGERCCHNMAVFGAETEGSNTLVPFDFDQAGLVNAPYATVDERLGIRRVTQRLYRGFCWQNDQLPRAVEHFNSKRAEIEALFNRIDLPSPRARKHALKYLEAFYTTINDSRKLQKKILSQCRD